MADRWRAWFLVLLLGGLGLRLAWIGAPPFFPDGFWMDERFSAAAIAQDIPRLIRFCREDVHPPLYYLALKGWNAVGLALFSGGGSALELADYRLPGIGQTGNFTLRSPDGKTREVAGLYPADWPDWPLAPLGFLRLLSLACLAFGAWALFSLGRLLLPERPGAALGAVALLLFSPFGLTWDTVMRSYSMQAAWLLAWGWAGARFAARGSLWAGAAAMAGIGAGALMTGYLAIVAAPFLSLAILARARPRRRALALWAGVAGAFVVFFLFWGDAFFSQAGLRRPGAEPAPPFAARLGAEAGRTIAAYWSTLFSWGLTGQVDPFSTPLAYYPLFFFYAAALGFALHGLIEAPSSGRIFLALAAAGPGAAAALANALRPDSLPIQARYFYAFAPWFYLWLCEGAAHGWAKCAEWTGRTRRYSRQR